MKTLVVERDGRITVHEVNKPRYNEYQALVKTIACGMCADRAIAENFCGGKAHLLQVRY